MLLAPIYAPAADGPSKGPAAFLAQSIHEFAPVVEGTRVTHEFIFENRGDQPLEIIKIESGWGCTAATSARQVPPGQEGRIQVNFDTGGYGGQKVRESVRIQTNDPNMPWHQVAVTGMVEKFAQIQPERVRLAGPAGQPLFVEVEIIPRKDLPFTISQIKAKSGDFITYQLIERCTDGYDRCVLRVENTRKEKGRYLDALFLSTTSELRPTIVIYVSGMIQ
jgi:hypothetical protein